MSGVSPITCGGQERGETRHASSAVRRRAIEKTEVVVNGNLSPNLSKLLSASDAGAAKTHRRVWKSFKVANSAQRDISLDA